MEINLFFFVNDFRDIKMLPARIEQISDFFVVNLHVRDFTIEHKVLTNVRLDSIEY